MARILAFSAIQHGFEQHDDIAFVKAGNQWVRTPLWLWQAQRPGGFFELLHHYGLHWYPAPKIEAAAIISLELEARSLLRFYRLGHQQHYYNLMKDEHRAVLQYERLQLAERGSLFGREKWQWISDKMMRKYNWITPDLVVWLWNEAVDMLKIDQGRRDLRRYEMMIRMINALTFEEWEDEVLAAA